MTNRDETAGMPREPAEITEEQREAAREVIRRNLDHHGDGVADLEEGVAQLLANRERHLLNGTSQRVDTTERPPAREVLAREICFRMDGIHGKTCCKCKSPADCRDWDASAFRFRENADAILTALAAAGYPVEASPALVEALEAVDKVTRISGDADFAEAFGDAMHLVRAALALANQEPAP